MKDVFLYQGRIVDDQFGLNKGPKEPVGTIEEVAEVVTRGSIAVVSSSFQTFRVENYLLTPSPKEK